MPKPKRLLFFLPIVAWLLVFYRTGMDMVSVWGQSKTFEHCFLIIPISLWVVWHKKDQLKSLSVSYAWTPVLLMVFPGALWLLGRAANIALFEHTAAVTSMQLLIWALLGNAITRQLWFPVLYLFFCVPFGEEIIPYLQDVTADLSVILLNASNIPVYRDGLYLTIPNGQFVVAEACSGIRFLISSIALGTLFAYLQFHKTWKRIAFVGFSFVFPIIANGIRAYGIIMIGHLTDMEHATGADHLVYGWVFFSLVMVVIFLTANVFADPPRPVRTRTGNTHYSPQSAAKVTGVITLMLLFLGTWGQVITRQSPLVTEPSVLPSNTISIAESRWGIHFPNAQQSVLAESQTGDALFFTARFALRQPQGELISSENRLYDKETWSLKQSSALELSVDTSATEITLTNQFGSSLKVVYWYCISDYCSSSPLLIKLFKATHLLAGGGGFADVYAVASPQLDTQQIERYAQHWQDLSLHSRL